MSDIFLKTLNMSIAASWLILVVVLFRFVLKKAPKWVNVLLWGIVALRLTVPFSFESALSLIPSAETFNIHNIQFETPAISSGIPAVNNAVNPILGETFAPNPGGSVNPLYVWTFIVSVIWLIGIAAMLLYAVISYIRVRRSVAERVPYEENIFLCDNVKSPFILGLAAPKIYLPSNMDAMAMEPVIAHEKAHLARRDHWWKPVGFLILAVHWFNPLCWIAYMLLCRDIELACDEKVIRQMDLDGKKQYSTALLECSTVRRLVTICPLAFGEIGVKERVRKVLSYKKPAFWVIVGAVVACAVVAVCFATNPKQDIPQEQRTVQVRITEVEDRSFLAAPVEGSLELSSSDLFRVSITNMPASPEPRVGDIVEITYDGVILESYPARFGTVYSMRVVLQEDPPEIEALRVKYPEYFELGTFKGLEVYVWKMAENYYRFGLMQGTNREKTVEEKMALKGASAEEMTLILSTFDIEDKDIFVIPWQSPISSYMVTKDVLESPEYINNVRAMLGLDAVSMGSTEINDVETAGYPNWPDTQFTLNEDGCVVTTVNGEIVQVSAPVPVPAEWARQDVGRRNEATTLVNPTFFWAGAVSSTEGWLVISWSRGVAVADTYVYRTSDGGLTWTETNHPSGTDDNYTWFPSQIGFLSADRLLIAYHLFFGTPVFLTKDGGATWEALDMPRDFHYEVENIRVDGNTVTLFLSGGAGSMVSRDLGDTWEHEPDAKGSDQTSEEAVSTTD